jgi:hypothetical protein
VQYNSLQNYTVVGKSMFTVVRIEKDTQVMIITIALLLIMVIITIIRRGQKEDK